LASKAGRRRSWQARLRVAAERVGDGQARPVGADLLSGGGDVLQGRWMRRTAMDDGLRNDH
jgi:hypothetical protein